MRLHVKRRARCGDHPNLGPLQLERRPLDWNVFVLTGVLVSATGHQRVWLSLIHRALLMSFSLYILYATVSLGSWFYVSRTQPRRASKSVAHRLLSLVVALHTVYILGQLLWFRPPNLFSRLQLPINAPVDRIKTILWMEAGFGHASNPPLPKDVELLLSRLAIWVNRGLFTRCTVNTFELLGLLLIATQIWSAFPTEMSILLFVGRLCFIHFRLHILAVSTDCYTSAGTHHRCEWSSALADRYARRASLCIPGRRVHADFCQCRTTAQGCPACIYGRYTLPHLPNCLTSSPVAR